MLYAVCWAICALNDDIYVVDDGRSACVCVHVVSSLLKWYLTWSSSIYYARRYGLCILFEFSMLRDVRIIRVVNLFTLLVYT